MVVVAFARPDGTEIARITVVAGQPVSSTGDVGWLDWNFMPQSVALGRRVSFHEDAEEWARSLPAAYAASSVKVTLVSDSPDVAAAPFGPPPPSQIAARTSGSGLPRFVSEHDVFNTLTTERRAGPAAVIVVCLLIAAYAIGLIGVAVALDHAAHTSTDISFNQTFQPNQSLTPGSSGSASGGS